MAFSSNKQFFQQQTSSGVTFDTSSFMGKTFKYTFFGILISALVAVGLGFLFTYLGVKELVTLEVLDTLMYGTMVVSGILVIFLSLFINIRMRKGERSLLTPAIIYAAAFGGLLSSLIVFIDWTILLTALGITVLSFGCMALIGSKVKNIKPIAIVVYSMLIGMIVLTIVSFLLIFLLPEVFVFTSFIFDYVYFAFIMLVTVFDVARLKRMSVTGYGSNDLALYMAVQLLTDFVYIFIKIVGFASRSRR